MNKRTIAICGVLLVAAGWNVRADLPKESLSVAVNLGDDALEGLWLVEPEKLVKWPYGYEEAIKIEKGSIQSVKRDGEPEERYPAAKIVVDAAKNPKTMTFTLINGKKWLAIYKIEEGKLTIAFNLNSDKIPAQFAAASHLRVYRRPGEPPPPPPPDDPLKEKKPPSKTDLPLPFEERVRGDEIPADESAKAVLIQRTSDGLCQMLGAVEKADNLGVSFRLANQPRAVLYPWKTVMAVRTTKADYFPDTKMKPFRKSLPRLDPNSPRLIGPLQAALKLENGNEAHGFVLSLIAEEVGFEAKRQNALANLTYLIYPAKDVRSVKIGNDIYVRDQKTNLFEKSTPADQDAKKPWPRKGILIAKDGRQGAADITAVDDEEVRILDAKAPGGRVIAWIDLRKVMIDTGDYAFDAAKKRAPFMEAKQSGKVRVLGPLPATLTLANGTAIKGTLLSLDGNELGFQADKEDHGTTYAGTQVQSVLTTGSTYLWDRNAAQFTRQNAPAPAQQPTQPGGSGNNVLGGFLCSALLLVWVPLLVWKLVFGKVCDKCGRRHAMMLTQTLIVDERTVIKTDRHGHSSAEDQQFVRDYYECKFCPATYRTATYQRTWATSLFQSITPWGWR